MKDPAFLFYSNDFLSGTMLMSNEEVGIYIKLLCLQHQQGHLKEEDMLSIGATKKIFSKFIKDDEGNYYNERLEYEANKRKAYSESRKNNRKKKETYEKDMFNICNSYEEHMENENINKNNIKNNSKKDSKGKKEEEKIHFADFITMTNAEHEKLVSTYGTEFTDQCIEILDNYKGSKGKEYKSDYRAILSWVVDEAKKRNQQNKYTQNKTAYNDYSQRSYKNLEGVYANIKEEK
nr:MAG TPA: Protein of unknown function (DUF1376) [Caudoviricetes sp.]